MDTQDLFDRGLATRKRVLGEDYVNASIGNADEFAMKLQEFITTHAWGAIWGPRGAAAQDPQHGPTSPCWRRWAGATSSACISAAR